jgi:archaellum component FlaF (FlaF/FlaG flagellin family)
MKPSNKELNDILERATAAIRSERVDQSVVEGAAERVRAKLSDQTATASAPTALVDQPDHIRSCGDFQKLIPEYMSGTLSPARSLLFEDHTHECIPCRKALKEARFGTAVPLKPSASRMSDSQRNVLRWAIAATVVIGIGLLSLTSYDRFFKAGEQFHMVVHAMDGQAYLVSDTSTEPLKVGEEIKLGDKVRTAKDAGAVVQLPDGSLIEMRERSEFSVTSNSQGTTIHLDRGNVIVEAAKQQESRHLYVQTNDCTVSVVGTIFSVNSATKGSRVSVVQGEVHVEHGSKQDVLHPGDQVATNSSIESVPVNDEVSWSRNAGHYKQMLADLRKEIDQRVASPAVRYSTRLLDMTPDDTAFYVAIPNLTGMLTESNKIIEERLNQNPELRQWWNKEEGSSRGNQEWDKVISKISQFGAQIGDEIVVTAQLTGTGKGDPDGPLVLTTLKDPAAFRSLVEGQLSTMSAISKKGPSIRFIDDPSALLQTQSKTGATGQSSDLYIWINGDVLAASPKLDFLQRVQTSAKAGSAQYADGSFKSRIADIYHDGAGFIIAADLQRFIAQSKGSDTKTNTALDRLGITNLKYFIAEMKEDQGKSFNRAVLSFSDSSHGIASWLAAPGPMGALQFISPDANVVAAFVVKEPVALVDDLMSTLSAVDPKFSEHLGEFQSQTGVNIREDFAKPLGGEFAFAVDGPLLPTPSWKLVFEVYDPAHLQQTYETIVNKMNELAMREGKKGFTLTQSEVGGRTYYTLKSLDFGLEVNYTYANGYLIAGPSRVLVENSVKYRESGYTLLHSSRFIAALPEDKQANFSALIYQNLSSVLNGFAKTVGGGVAQNLPEEQRRGLNSLVGGPVLAYAYAQGDHISFALNGEEGPIGLKPSSLIGMPGSFGLRNIVEHAVR